MYTRLLWTQREAVLDHPGPALPLYERAAHGGVSRISIYGVRESGGFIQLTGEVGTGKTTLVRSLLQQLPENADVALILNPQLSTRKRVSAVRSAEELGVTLPEHPAYSIKTLTTALNEFPAARIHMPRIGRARF